MIYVSKNISFIQSINIPVREEGDYVKEMTQVFFGSPIILVMSSLPPKFSEDA